MEHKIDENRWNQPKPTIDENLMKIDEDWWTLKLMKIDENCRSSKLMKNADTKKRWNGWKQQKPKLTNHNWWKLMKPTET